MPIAAAKRVRFMTVSCDLVAARDGSGGTGPV
jgi:hypothetical protein